MTFNDAAFQIIMKEPEVVSLVKEGAEEVLRNAKAIAPVVTGDYRDSLSVVRDDKGGVPRFLVVSADPAALYIESQSGTLARATGMSKGG